jgi:hypothetical protein
MITNGNAEVWRESDTWFRSANRGNRLVQRGARIRAEIHQHGYRSYEAEDLEGNKWIFAQARPTM